MGMRIRHGFVRCENGEWLNVMHVTGFMVGKCVDGRYAGYIETKVGRCKVTSLYKTEDQAQVELDNGMG
jgi:hypothetical protein